MNPDCQIFIVMGKTDPTAPPAPAAVDDPGPARHPGRRRSCAALPVFGYDDAPRRPRRDRSSTTSGCPATNLIGGEGERLRDRPGPARPRPHPPLHALARHGRAGPGADVPRGRSHASRVRQADRRAGRRARVDRRVAHAHRAGPAAGAQDRVADGHRRQPGRPHRDRGHQGRGAQRRARAVLDRAIQVHGAGGRQRGLPAGRVVRRHRARCASPTARTRCTSARWPARNCVLTGQPLLGNPQVDLVRIRRSGRPNQHKITVRGPVRTRRAAGSCPGGGWSGTGTAPASPGAERDRGRRRGRPARRAGPAPGPGRRDR